MIKFVSYLSTLFTTSKTSKQGRSTQEIGNDRASITNKGLRWSKILSGNVDWSIYRKGE